VQYMCGVSNTGHLVAKSDRNGAWPNLIIHIEAHAYLVASLLSKPTVSSHAARRVALKAVHTGNTL